MIPSLHVRLLYPLLWLWVTSAVLATISAFWLVGRSTSVAFDRILADDAHALAMQVYWDSTGPIFAMNAGDAASLVYDSLSPTRFAVRTRSGKTLVGDARLLPPDVHAQHPSSLPIFQNRTTASGELRVVSLLVGAPPGQEPVWVLVAEDETKRQQMREELARAIFLPAVLVGFVIVPLLVFWVRHGLKMAGQTSENVTSRSLNDLSPLPMDDVPQELRPLVTRINDLLAKLKSTLAHERQFIAEAAHQLRTPVSGIRLLTKDLMRTGRLDPGAPADPEVLAELDAAASRATHLVQQLLSLARAETGSNVQRQSVEVDVLMETILKKWQRTAREVGKSLIGLPPALTGGANSIADPLVLQDAWDNLIENALLYGGPQCQIMVRSTGQQICVEVLDNGEPLSADVLLRMREPFWRATGEMHQPGSGLGLSIADRAANAFGGRLDIDSGTEIGGTRIRFFLSQDRSSDA